MHNTPGTDKDRNPSLKYRIPIRIAVLGTAFAIALVIGAAGAVFAAYHYAKPGLPEAATVREIPLEVPLRVYSRDGRLMQVVRLSGFLFETADSEELNYRATLRDAMLRTIGSSQTNHRAS